MAGGVKIRDVEATHGRFAQIVALRVGPDADDHKIQYPIRRAGPDPATDRIRRSKVCAGHRLIDQADKRRIAFIFWPNFAASEDRNAHRREITRPDIIADRAHPPLRRSRLALNRDVCVKAYTVEEAAQGQTRAAHARDGADALKKLLVELVRSSGIWRGSELKKLRAVITQLNPRQFMKAAREQPGNDQ